MLALPIAGTIAWTAAGVLGAVLPDAESASKALFLCMPAVFPLALLIGRVTGEDVFGAKGRNELDGLFLHGMLMSNLVWCIAIPLWLTNPSTLPLTAGILAGLAWVPLSWIIGHWVGLFHAIARSILVAVVWTALPAHRFTAVPAVVVAVYLVSIAVLARRKLPR